MVRGWMGAWASLLYPTGSQSEKDNADTELGAARTSPFSKVLPAECSGFFNH